MRDGYDQLVADIRAGAVAELICHEQSRMTRLPEVWNALVITLTKAGITKIHTVQQGTISVEEGTVWSAAS